MTSSDCSLALAAPCGLSALALDVQWGKKAKRPPLCSSSASGWWRRRRRRHRCRPRRRRCIGESEPPCPQVPRHMPRPGRRHPQPGFGERRVAGRPPAPAERSRVEASLGASAGCRTEASSWLRCSRCICASSAGRRAAICSGPSQYRRWRQRPGWRRITEAGGARLGDDLAGTWSSNGGRLFRCLDQWRRRSLIAVTTRPALANCSCATGVESVADRQPRRRHAEQGDQPGRDQSGHLEGGRPWPTRRVRDRASAAALRRRPRHDAPHRSAASPRRLLPGAARAPAAAAQGVAPRYRRRHPSSHARLAARGARLAGRQSPGMMGGEEEHRRAL